MYDEDDFYDDDGAEFRLGTMALDINTLIKENRKLRRENARLADFEQKYNDLVMESIRNSEAIMGSWINVLCSGKIKVGVDNNG